MKGANANQLWPAQSVFLNKLYELYLEYVFATCSGGHRTGIALLHGHLWYTQYSSNCEHEATSRDWHNYSAKKITFFNFINKGCQIIVTHVWKPTLNCCIWKWYLFNVVLSNSMWFFVYSNTIRNLARKLKTRLVCLLYLPVKSIREDFRTLSFFLKKYIFPAYSWTFSKCYFNILTLMLSGLSILLHKTHWGFSIFLFTISAKPKCKNASLYERFFPILKPRQLKQS